MLDVFIVFFVVTYDLPATKAGNKRRRKLAKLLEGFGDRAQFSVFEVDVTQEDYEKMIHKIEKLVDPENDQVRVYPLSTKGKKDLHIIGEGEPFHIEDAYFF